MPKTKLCLIPTLCVFLFCLPITTFGQSFSSDDVIELGEGPLVYGVGDFVFFEGSFEGKGVPLNNAYSVACWKAYMTCWVSKAFQTARKKVTLAAPEPIPISSWQRDKIIADDSPVVPADYCNRNSFIISLTEKTVDWYVTPINLEIPQCRNSSKKLIHLRLTEPLSHRTRRP